MAFLCWTDIPNGLQLSWFICVHISWIVIKCTWLDFMTWRFWTNSWFVGEMKGLNAQVVSPKRLLQFFCDGNPAVTEVLPVQRASYSELGGFIVVSLDTLLNKPSNGKMRHLNAHLTSPYYNGCNNVQPAFPQQFLQLQIRVFLSCS